jgi:hypothetical protein
MMRVGHVLSCARRTTFAYTRGVKQSCDELEWHERKLARSLPVKMMKKDVTQTVDKIG